MVRIHQVIHGYQTKYNSGSKVYAQGLIQALSERYGLHIYTRQENAFLLESAVQRESNLSDPTITVHVVNIARDSDGYRHAVEDASLAVLLDGIRPHVNGGHLKQPFPTVYLHDNEEVIGSPMSETRVRDVPGYGIDVGRSTTTAVASACDHPTGSTRPRISTLEPG